MTERFGGTDMVRTGTLFENEALNNGVVVFTALGLAAVSRTAPTVASLISVKPLDAEAPEVSAIELAPCIIPA